MKLVRIIMIKLLLNVCTCLHSNCHDFCQNIYLHVISTTFETRLPRYSLRFSLERLKLCQVTGKIQSLWIFCQNKFLKLCRKDNLCQSQEAFKLLLIKINFTFSGGQKSRIFWSSWNLLRSQFWNLEHFFSSPEHKVLKVSYCDHPVSGVRRQSSVVRRVSSTIHSKHISS